MFDKLKKVLLNLKNNITGGIKKTATNVVQKYTPFANPEVNKGQGNFWSQDNSGKVVNPVAKGLTFAQDFFANNKKVAIPKTDLTFSFNRPVPEFQIKPENTLKTKILKTVGNLPGTILNPVIDFTARTGQDVGQMMADNNNRLLKKESPVLNYDTAKSGATRLLMQAGSKLDKSGNFQKNTNTKISVKEVVGNLADPAEFAFNMALLGKGKEAKTILKEVVDVATSKGFKKTLLKGMAEGAKIGGVFTGLEGLKSNRTETDNVKYVINMAKDIAGGATGGAVLGGVTTAIPAALGAIKSQIKKLRSGIADKEAGKLAETFLRDEMGRFTGAKPKNKDVVFYGDLRESLGLSRDGSYVPQPGLSTRNLTAEEHAINPANVLKKPGEVVPIDKKFFNPSASGEVVKAGPKTANQIIQETTLGKAPQQQKLPLSVAPGETTKPIKTTGPKTAEQIISENTSGKVTPPIKKPSTTGQIPSTEELFQQTPKVDTQVPGQNNSFDKIISEGKKQIGSIADEPKKPLSQHFDDFYTDWVDRYNPIMKVVGMAEKAQKKIGAEIRPEFNPKYTVRRFLGMGGIAEQRFQDELKPLIGKMDELKINKGDMDLYLKSRRDINLAGRNIKGSDAAIATKYINAIESKYGAPIKEIADKFYSYQDQGLQELADAGFLSTKSKEAIKTANKDYVPFQRIMDEVDEFLGMPTKVVQQSTNPVKKIEGSEKQIYSPMESIIMNTFKQRAAIEKNRVAQTVVGLEKFVPGLTFPKTDKLGSNAIAVWENGTKQYYQVGEDIAKAMRGMNEETMNSWSKILTAPAALLRQGATGRNPDFMVPNVVRDQLDAAINSKYGYIPFVDYIKGLYHVAKKDITGADTVFDQWVKAGGSQSFSSLTGRKSVGEMFNEKTASKNLFQWVNSKTFGALSKGLDVMGKYSETPTRVGLFGNAMKKTGNATLAAYESREGTMDFSRMGAKMKVANSIIPFLNVGVQGLDKVMRNFKDNPAQFAVRMGIYGVTPTVMSTLYNLTQFPEEYKEIPQYVKDSNFVLVSGRNEKGTIDYVTIPKGNVITLVSNPVESFLSYLADADTQTLGEFATSFLSSALPVIGDGSTPGEVAIKTIGSNLPQAIKPITENLLNKSFFKYNTKTDESKEIVPYYLKKKAPADQSYEFTPTMYKAIGTALKVSPLQVQNLMEGYLAGYTKIPANIIESLKNVSEGKEVSKNETPILRRFIQETYPTGESKTTKKAPQVSSLIQKAQAAEGTPGEVAQATGVKGFLQNIFKSSPEKIKKRDEQAVSNFIQTNSKSDIESMPTGTRYEKAQKQKASYTLVDNVIDSDLTDTQKSIAFEKLGVNVEDANYYLVAKTTATERHAFIQDALEKPEADKYDTLIAMRKYVNGKRILSDDVIDDLVDDEMLTKEEAKELKKIKFDDNGKLKTGTGTGTGKGITKAKLKTYKTGVKNAYEKFYSARAKSTKMPELDTNFFQVKPNANTLKRSPQKSSGSVQLTKPKVQSIPIEQLFKKQAPSSNVSKARQLVTGGGYAPSTSSLKLSKSSYRSR